MYQYWNWISFSQKFVMKNFQLPLKNQWLNLIMQLKMWWIKYRLFLIKLYLFVLCRMGCQLHFVIWYIFLIFFFLSLLFSFINLIQCWMFTVVTGSGNARCECYIYVRYSMFGFVILVNRLLLFWKFGYIGNNRIIWFAIQFIDVIWNKTNS